MRQSAENVICQECDLIVPKKEAFKVGMHNENTLYNCHRCVPFRIMKATYARRAKYEKRSTTTQEYPSF